MFFCPPPRSAFFIFCSEFRPKVKGESPGLSIGDVAKRLGEMWNSTAAEDKQPFEKKAAKLKEKYEKVRVKCERRLSSSVTAIFVSRHWFTAFSLLPRRTSLRIAQRANQAAVRQRKPRPRQRRKTMMMTTTMKMRRRKRMMTMRMMISRWQVT